MVATGNMVVDRSGIRIGGTPDAPDWNISFEDLLSVSTEVGDQLFIRRRDDTDRGELFRLETGTQSTYKWGSILQAWKRSSRPVT